MGCFLLQEGKHLLRSPVPFTAGQQIAEPRRYPFCSWMQSWGIRFFCVRIEIVFSQCSAPESCQLWRVPCPSWFRSSASGTLQRVAKGVFIFRDCQTPSQASCLWPLAFARLLTSFFSVFRLVPCVETRIPRDHNLKSFPLLAWESWHA